MSSYAEKVLAKLDPLCYYLDIGGATGVLFNGKFEAI
jgi:hypothetical protein